MNKKFFFILLFLFNFKLLASEESIVSIKSIEEKLPSYNLIDIEIDEKKSDKLTQSKFFNPNRIVEWKKIISSGKIYSSVRGGVPIVRLEDNKLLTVTKDMIVSHFNLGDENGFKYVLSRDQSVKFKIDSQYLQNINRELDLYVPPEFYTEYRQEDDEISLDMDFPVRYEIIFYGAIVKPDFIQDLLNESPLGLGHSFQIGTGAFLDWKYLIRPGLVLNFEKSQFKLPSGGNSSYQSFSFGPQFKTKNFELNRTKFNLNLHFRVGPLSELKVISSTNNKVYEFNSTDVLFSLDIQRKNYLGEFIWGPFLNTQWLNLKNQTETVNIRGSNKSNLVYGLRFGQVF